MSTCGIIAAMKVEAATDREIFLTYLDEVLCPQLEPGDVVVMDNLSSHKVDGVRQRIEARQAELPYLPPYSPDLNLIEKPGPKSSKDFARPRPALPKRSIMPLQRPSQKSHPTTRKRGSGSAFMPYS
jgi:transposase